MTPTRTATKTQPTPTTVGDTAMDVLTPLAALGVSAGLTFPTAMGNARSAADQHQTELAPMLDLIEQGWTQRNSRAGDSYANAGVRSDLDRLAAVLLSQLAPTTADLDDAQSELARLEEAQDTAQADLAQALNDGDAAAARTARDQLDITLPARIRQATAAVDNLETATTTTFALAASAVVRQTASRTAAADQRVAALREQLTEAEQDRDVIRIAVDAVKRAAAATRPTAEPPVSGTPLWDAREVTAPAPVHFLVPAHSFDVADAQPESPLGREQHVGSRYRSVPVTAGDPA